MPDLITASRLAEIKARVAMPHERYDIPDLISTLERAVELLRKEHHSVNSGCPACVFVKEFDHDK